MQAFAVLLLLGLSAFATDAATDAATEADNFADAILKDLRVMIVDQEMDPLILPIKSFEFHQKVLFLNVTGVARVYDGYLKGIKTIKRTGKTEKIENTTHVEVRTTIGYTNLDGHYAAEAKFMKIGPRFEVKLGIESLNVDFVIAQSRVPASRPVLTFFHVTKTGKVTADITSNIPLIDWLINIVDNFVINLVKDAVVSFAEVPLRKLILDILNTADLPDFTGTSSTPAPQTPAPQTPAPL